MSIDYDYGVLANGRPARRHRGTGEVEFLLWMAGQQGHSEGYWHKVGEGWNEGFVKMYGVTRSIGQSKAMSLVEASTNTAVGLVIAYFAQLWFFRVAQIQITDEQNVALVLFMTVVSIARSYALRRLFNGR